VHRPEPRQQVVHVQVRVPNRQHRGGRELPHRLPVRAQPAPHDSVALLARELVLAAGDLQTGGQALDVPFPWAPRGLVEVVDVEDEATLGRPEGAEVRQVRVAAGLNAQA
jgi:hypothetical protein